MNRFDDLCAKYRKRLVADLRRFGAGDDAEDIAHEALLAVWGRIDTVAEEAEWVYLKTTAHRLHLNRRRTSNAEIHGGGRVASLEPGSEPKHDTPPVSAETRLLIAEFNARFAAAMRELTPENREIVVRRRRGESSKEIAAALGISDAGIRKRISRALEKLRELVGPPPPHVEWASLLGEDDDDHQK